MKKYINTTYGLMVSRLRRMIHSIGPFYRVIDYYSYHLHYSKGTSIVERFIDSGSYEDDLCRLIIKDLGKFNKPMFMDVGANVGLITLRVLSEVKDVSKVFALEPGPHQNELFRMTIGGNKLGDKIILENVALSNKDGQIEFSVHNSKDVSGDGIKDTGKAGKFEKIRVKSLTLDSWWDKHKHPKINAIKIDTEGSEYLILKDGRKMLRKEKPILYFEMWPDFTKIYNYSCDNLIDLLESYKYSVFTLNGVLITKKNKFKFFGKESNYVAYPQK